MDIDCSICGTTISFVDSPPKFCQECGTPIGSTVSIGSNTEPSNNVDRTIAPSADPPAISRSLHQDEPGKIGPYQLIEILGAGGMGVVWKAINENTGRKVALKRLSRNHLSEEKSVQRFYREAQLASKISHSRVTFVYGVGDDEGQPYIAMELMPGETLSDRVKQNGPLPIGDAVDKILDVIDGLVAAHDLGLIHRDVKPSNCFIDAEDRVKVGDFGLSKSVAGDDVNLTRTGTFMGTPAYAAPEQIRGATLDERTDIYAVGATLCFLLTGRAPFVGDAMSVTAQIISDTCKIEEDIPKELKNIIYRSLNKKPDSRFPKLGELRNALMPFAGGQNAAAEFGRRVSAFMIDMFGVSVVMGLGNSLIGAWAGGRAQVERIPVEETLESMGLFAALTGFAIPFIYFLLFESIFGRSIGKQIVGLKVVDMDGGKPAWYRVLLRSFLMPGGAAIPLLLGVLISMFWHVHMDALELTLQGLVNNLMFLVPLGIIGSPLLRFTDARGFHETLSGTRVIMERRIPGRQLGFAPPPEFDSGVLQAGCYEVGQAIYHSQSHQIYRGLDSTLKREVWILSQPGGPPSASRIELSRLVRPHWLDGGYFDDGNRWDAYEAIDGLPITIVLDQRKYPLEWPELRDAFDDLAHELKASIEDGTLPRVLSMSQVWLDKNCHVKIIDIPLATDSDTDKLELFDDADPVVRAVSFFKAVAGRVDRSLVLPVESKQFLKRLQQQPSGVGTLDWAVKQLKSKSNKVGALTWETRCGILGLTLGLEYVIYTSLASCLFVFMYFGLSEPTWVSFPLGLIASLIVPVTMGIVYGGGIVFHLLGVTVTDLKGNPATKLRIAIRSAFAWLPAIAMSGIWIFFPLLSKIQDPNNETEAGSLARYIKETPSIALLILLGSLVASFVMLLGAAISIWRAKRGLQDYVAGTRLLQK